MVLGLEKEVFSYAIIKVWLSQQNEQSALFVFSTVFVESVKSCHLDYNKYGTH